MLLFLLNLISIQATVMEFKDRLKDTRSQKKISQNELATAIGVHVSNISRYERGENMPTTEVMNKLAAELNTTSDFLMNGSTDEVASENISDKELLSLFKKVNNLSSEKKMVVKEFLDAFTFKNDIQQKLAAQ